MSETRVQKLKNERRRSEQSETLKTAKVKTGSIVFFDGKDAVSNIIKLGTLGKWSHVGITIIMTNTFKNNFVMFLQRMKKLTDEGTIPMPSPHLPISDHRFGMLNNVAGYAAFVKKEFKKERSKQASLHYTVFQKKLREKTNGVCYSPLCDPSEKIKTQEIYLNPEDCVKCVVAELNNVLYHWKNANAHVKKYFHKTDNDATTATATTAKDRDYLEQDTVLGENIINHKSTRQTFNKSSFSGKLTMGNEALTETLLSVLSDDRTFDVEHVFSKRNNDTPNEHLKNFSNLSSNNVSGQPQIVFLVHVIQVIQAFNLVEMSSLSKDIQTESNGANATTMRTPYIWESTTDTNPDCYDELMSESTPGVKMDLLNNRLDAKSYHAFSKRDIAFQQSSLKPEKIDDVLLKSTSNSTIFEPFAAMLPRAEISKHGENAADRGRKAFENIKDEDVMFITPTTSLRSQSSMSESRYAHLFRSVSTISRTEENRRVNNDKSNKRTYQKVLSERNSYETTVNSTLSSSDLKNGSDFRLQTIYEQQVYKAIICNMIINHGKSYQTTVTDFMMAVIQEYARCFCCSSNAPKNNDDDVRIKKNDPPTDDDSTDDDDREYRYEKVHNDEENSEFFCSELVYQTLMDLKLILEYRALINDFGLFLNPKNQNKAKAFHLLTIDDFENEDEYYAFMVALASLLILKCGLVEDFFDTYSFLGKRFTKENLEAFVKKKNEWSSRAIATKMTSAPIVMSSCCVTPVDLFNLDISTCLGIPVHFSEGAYHFDDDK